MILLKTWIEKGFYYRNVFEIIFIRYVIKDFTVKY